MRASASLTLVAGLAAAGCATALPGEEEMAAMALPVMVDTGAAWMIADACPDLALDPAAGQAAVVPIEARAGELGWSPADEDLFFARISRDAVLAASFDRLGKAGLSDPDAPASEYCALGRREMRRGTQLGALLQ